MTRRRLHLTVALIAGQASREITVSPPEADRYDQGKAITPGVVFSDFRFHAPDWKTPRSHPFQPRHWESA